MNETANPDSIVQPESWLDRMEREVRQSPTFGEGRFIQIQKNEVVRMLNEIRAKCPTCGG